MLTETDTGGAVTASASFTYDKAGNVKTAVNSNGSYVLTYDNNNDVITVSEPNGASLWMSYDSMGDRAILLNYAPGNSGSQFLTYDKDDRLSTLLYYGAGGNLVSETLTYFNTGQVNTATLYNGATKIATTTDSQAGNGNLTSILEQYANGSTMASYDYGYDGAGRVTSTTINGGSPTTYSYDPAGQMTGAGTQGYSYDANGNPTGGADATAADNRLTTFVDSSGNTWSYSYDNVGNRTQALNTTASVTWNYTYDNANHLASATETTGATTLQRVSYGYDAYGNLVTETMLASGGGTTTLKYAVDGWNPANQGGPGLSNFTVWGVMNSSGLMTHELYSVGTVSGPEETPLVRIDSTGASDPSGTYWTLTDRQGSVSYVLNNTPNAAPVASFVYGGYGNITSGNTAYLGLIGYAGYVDDGPTQLYLVHDRVYDSVSQRWIEQDPTNFGAGDPDLYRYAGNDPMNETDPSGLEAYGSGDPEVNAMLNTAQGNGYAAGSLPIYNIAAGGNQTAFQAAPWLPIAGRAVDDVALPTLTGVVGAVDSLSMGLTTRIRTANGISQPDVNSAAYIAGSLIGSGIGIGLAFFNPCNLSAGMGTLLRAFNGIQALGGALNFADNVSQGSPMAILDALGVLGNVGQMFRLCFTGDHVLDTPYGKIRWDKLNQGDWLACCVDNDPHGKVEYKRVLQKFTWVEDIWHVVLAGKLLRTTKHHRFFIWDKGWVSTRHLRPGDQMRTRDGGSVTVEKALDAGYRERVYNCQVQDNQTYFVGGDNWGFSVWAHNDCGLSNVQKADYMKNVFSPWAKVQGLSTAERQIMRAAIKAEWAVGSSATWENAVKGLYSSAEKMRGMGWILDSASLGYGAALRYGVDLGFRQVINGVTKLASVEAKGYNMILTNGIINLNSITVFLKGRKVGAYAGDAVWTLDRLTRAVMGGNAAASPYLAAAKSKTLQYFTSFTNKLIQWK